LARFCTSRSQRARTTSTREPGRLRLRNSPRRDQLGSGPRPGR
jgi:hypothetical protein